MSDKKPEEMSEDELDQIIEDMAKEETASAPVLSLARGTKAATKTASEQSLTLELKGVIDLKLCFASGDRSIEVLCTEDALLCRMADGTEFKIPTGMKNAKRNAA